MKRIFKRTKKTELDLEVDYQLSEMFKELKNLQQNSEESDKDFIRRRQAMRIEAIELLEKSGKFRETKAKIDWTSVFIGTLSLVEIILIIGVENIGELITSKAFSRALRGRV